LTNISYCCDAKGIKIYEKVGLISIKTVLYPYLGWSNLFIYVRETRQLNQTNIPPFGGSWLVHYLYLLGMYLYLFKHPEKPCKTFLHEVVFKFYKRKLCLSHLLYWIEAITWLDDKVALVIYYYKLRRLLYSGRLVMRSSESFITYTVHTSLSNPLYIPIFLSVFTVMQFELLLCLSYERMLPMLSSILLRMVCCEEKFLVGLQYRI